MNNESQNESSKSKAIVKQIEKKFLALDDLIEKSDNEKSPYFDIDLWADVSHIDKKYFPGINELKQDIRELLDKLYYASHEDDYFYFDCSLKVYKKHYNNRKLKYFQKVLDATEEDFIISEVSFFSNTQNRTLPVFIFDKRYDDYIDFEDKYRIPLIKKLEFLDEKIKPFGKSVQINEIPTTYDEAEGTCFCGYISADVTERTDVIKVSNDEIIENPEKTEKQLTANQIVLLLQETGFFAHPKIEGASKVKQSELISKICGLNSKNIKGKIENLDKKLSELGANHQKDMDKIEDILNNME